MTSKVVLDEFNLDPRSPEPDPRVSENLLRWVHWYRYLTGVSLLMARDALLIRRSEWAEMETLTQPR